MQQKGCLKTEHDWFQRGQNKYDCFIYILWPVELVAVVILEQSKASTVFILDVAKETKLTDTCD